MSREYDCSGAVRELHGSAVTLLIACGYTSLSETTWERHVECASRSPS
jgi:hypothetical protein